MAKDTPGQSRRWRGLLPTQTCLFLPVTIMPSIFGELSLPMLDAVPPYVRTHTHTHALARCTPCTTFALPVRHLSIDCHSELPHRISFELQVQFSSLAWLRREDGHLRWPPFGRRYLLLRNHQYYPRDVCRKKKRIEETNRYG